MPERTRRLIADLVAIPTEAPLPPTLTAHHPAPEDQPAFARLMFDAYAGTVDDEGETLADAEAEMARIFAGAYGPFDPECSFLARDAGEVVSASLITQFEGRPLIAYTFTTPRRQRKGLARALLTRSIAALRDRGDTTLVLFVTASNDPAEHLYESLGFTEDVSRES